MSIPLETLDTHARPVCRMLRTKTAFGSYELEGGDSPWQAGESSTAVYWCLCTMDTSGPDNHFAHPQHCATGRACFQPPLD